jgi:hypothetical protein
MMNQTWKEITLERYLEWQSAFLDGGRLGGIALMENKTTKELKNLTVLELNNLVNRYLFLEEDILEKTEFDIEDMVLNIDKEKYVINKNFETLSFEQWENIDAVLKNDKNVLKNIHILLGIAIQKREEYTYDKAEQLSEKIKAMSMYDVAGCIGFFLLKEIQSSQSLTLYFQLQVEQKIQTINFLIMQLTSLMKFGVGISLWTNFRMRILRSTMSSLKKRLVKYLHI